MGLFDVFKKKKSAANGNVVKGLSEDSKLENRTRENGNEKSIPQSKLNPNWHLISYYDNLKLAGKKQGGIFWFDIKSISDEETIHYGRYVYQLLFNIISAPNTSEFFVFDGDLIGGRSEIIMLNENEEKKIMELLKHKPSFGLMIGGTFWYNLSYFDIYFTDNAKGYLGMTRLPPFDQYYNLKEFADKACFVHSLCIINNEIKKLLSLQKVSFNYLSDIELTKLGYKIVDITPNSIHS